VPAPDAKRKPVEPKVERVEYPRYIGPNEYGRSTYDAGLKKYGTLDKWYEAYQKYTKVIDTHSAKVREWQNSQTLRLGEGLVLDSKGVPSQNSVDTMRAKVRAAKRKAQIERQKRDAEYAKQRKAQEREYQKQQREFEKREKELAVKLRKANPELKAIKDASLVSFLAKKAVKVDAKKKTATLFKAVQSDGRSFNSGNSGHVTYEVGKTVECPDYNTRPDCTGGLFFLATGAEAKQYVGWGKVIQCEVDLDTMIVVQGTKVKSKSCKVIKEVK
jgi:esterase/lipase